MIRPEGRAEEVRKMSATLDSTLADPHQIIAELRRKLTEAEAERDGALAQQTATAEVLGVINSSGGDLAPVFEAMLERAARLCSAGFGALWIYNGEQFHAAAVHAMPAALADYVREPVPARDSASLVEIVRGQAVVHVPDLAATELYRAGNPVRRAYVDLGGARTLLTVALRKDTFLLGAFNIYRQEVRPFSDKEIRLVENFAAQAVIAMENARLITETREALEQQTATAKVLRVINASPGDLTPVFDAILEKAHTLCGADSGGLVLIEGEQYRPIAVHGKPTFTDLWVQEGWIKFALTGTSAQLQRGEPLHIPHLAAYSDRFSDQVKRIIALSGAQSML
jgi:GAF domain-containing protein